MSIKRVFSIFKKDLSEKELASLKKGIKLDEGIAVFDKIQKVRTRLYKVIIHQGWNRQIRRMFKAVDNEVLELKRVRIAGLKLGGLPEGKYVVVSRDKFMRLINQDN